MSHIEQIRNGNQVLMNLVLIFTGLSEAEYLGYMYECGCEYIRRIAEGDQEAVKELEASEIFWGWWKAEWMIRDEEYTCPQTMTMELFGRKRVWFQFHSPALLVADTEIGRHMSESFARIIGLIIRNSVKRKV